MAKDCIKSGWSDVEELEPYAKTGMANVQVRVCGAATVFRQCEKLLGEELQDWRGSTIGLMFSQYGITGRATGGHRHTGACPAMVMITMQQRLGIDLHDLLILLELLLYAVNIQQIISRTSV